MKPREIVPGVYHWRAFHQGIRHEVSSYYLAGPALLLDPLLPAEGFDGGDPVEWLREQGPPAGVVLSNRHHYRDSGRLADALDIPVHASEPGMHEFSPEQHVRPFQFGDELADGVVAHEVGAICPDETAFEVRGARALAVADGVVRFESMEAPLGFVPDGLMGDDAEAIKERLRAAYRRLLELDFDHLLLAHGDPLVDDGKVQLQAFLEG